MKKFNVNEFVNGFNITIKALAESERITKDALRSLSRDLLCQLHTIEDNPRNGDIGFTNQVLAVLTPVNKKVFTLFMVEFSGFKFNEEIQQFEKKDRAKYNDVFTKAGEFLEDPLNNLWTWAERNVKVEKKAFKLDTLAKDVKRALAQENDAGELMYSKADIIKAVLSGGITSEELLDLLAAIE